MRFRTIQSGSKWLIVDDDTGEIQRPRFHYEQQAFDWIDQKLAAALRRKAHLHADVFVGWNVYEENERVCNPEMFVLRETVSNT